MDEKQRELADVQASVMDDIAERLERVAREYREEASFLRYDLAASPNVGPDHMDAYLRAAPASRVASAERVAAQARRALLS